MDSALIKKVLFPIFLFIFVFFIYIITLSPSISAVGDSGELVTNCFLGGINHPPGYPLYTILGYIFSRIPYNNIAWRINLMSAFFSSLSIGILFLILIKLTRNSFYSIAGALFFAFSLLFWRLSLVAEVFSLNLLFVGLLILILLKWNETKKEFWGLLFFLVAGLSITHHFTILLVFPAFIFYYILSQRMYFNSKFIIKAIIFFLIGLLPYIYIPLCFRPDIPLSWGNLRTLNGFVKFISRQSYGSFFLAPQAQQFHINQFLIYMKIYFKSLAVQFSFIGLILGVSGALILFKKRFSLLVFILFGFIFSGPIFILMAHPPLSDPFKAIMERFYLPSFLFYFLLIMATLVVIDGWIKPKFAIFVLRTAIVLSLIMFIWINFNKVNQKNNYIARDFGLNTLKNLPANTILFSGSDTVTMILMYLQEVENLRKDILLVHKGLISSWWYLDALMRRYPEVKIIPATDKEMQIIYIIRENYPQRPIYFSFIPDFLKDNLSCEGLVYKYCLNKEDRQKSLLKLKENLEQNYIYPEFKVNQEDYFSSEIFKLYADGFYNLGAEMGSNELAGKYYLKAISFDPDFYEAFFNLGLINFKSKKYSKAREYFLKALKLNPKEPRIYLNLGSACYGCGNLNEAEIYFKKAVGLDPGLCEGYYNLGIICQKTGREREAEQFFLKSREIEKNK